MSRPTEEPDVLAKQLHTWAMQEMHFRPKGRFVNSPLPTPEDFKGICRGQMVDVWKFVLERAHSAQTVQKVQGNLALHAQKPKKGYNVCYQSDQKYSEARAELEEQRRHLAAELVNCRTAVSHVERDLDRIHRDITVTGQGCKKAQDCVHDTLRKTALLKEQSEQVAENIQQYEEFTTRLRNKTKRLQSFSQGTTEGETLYSRTQHDTEQNSQPLENACTRDVRESCELIGSFLNQLLQGSFGADKIQMVKQKERLWQEVEKIFSNQSIHQVVLSLCVHAQDTALSLRDKTAAVSIAQDAESLRFKYQKGGQLSDMSSPPSVLQSMRHLLEEGQVAQFQRFMQTEKSKNSVFKLRKRYGHAEELVHDLLSKQYRGNPGALELARKLLETEIQTCTARTSVRSLSEVVQDLLASIARSKAEKEALYSRYRRIQDFKKLADNKQNLIRVLVKQNINGRPRLEEQRAEIALYIQQAMGSHCPDTRSLTSDLQDGVKREVDGFMALSLPYLMLLRLDSVYKVAVMDLSINRLHVTGTDSPGGQALDKVLQALEFPAHKSPECLLQWVVDLQTEIEETQTALTTQSRLAKAGHDSIVEHVAALCQRVDEHNNHLLATVLPTSQGRLALATQGLAACIQIKDTTQHWWDQPGQVVAPWVKVDDLTLQQWKDKWTVVVTRLRQTQIQSQ